MILLTGFEPFAGATENPSRLGASRAAQLLRDEGIDAVFEELPCAFAPSRERLREAVARHRPDVVICVGLAEGRTTVSLERFALNHIDARIPDNAGEQPVDVPVAPGAPLALPTRLPVKRAKARIEAAGIPVSLSLSAGSYVCNTVFYASVHELPHHVAAGFVHVPLEADLTIEQQADALVILAREALAGGSDLTVPGGVEH